jgi:hypothetical protein
MYSSHQQQHSYQTPVHAYLSESSSSFSYCDSGEPSPFAISPSTTRRRRSSIHDDDASSQSMLHYYKDKPLRSNNRLNPLLKFLQRLFQEPWSLVGLLLLIGVVVGIRQRAHRAWVLREFHHAQSYQEAVQVWRRLQENHQGLSEDYDELYQAQTKWEARDVAWRQHVQALHNFTQQESRRAVLDKFGAGPHYVSIQVILPQDANPASALIHPDTPLSATPAYNSQHIRSFQVELAPLSDMPHATHLFLEQVSHKLWDRQAGFYVNHPHVMQAGPRTKAARQQFVDYNLEKLAFPEYSDKFPHVPWTLGYAGRPGGPSFYINKVRRRGWN